MEEVVGSSPTPGTIRRLVQWKNASLTRKIRRSDSFSAYQSSCDVRVSLTPCQGVRSGSSPDYCSKSRHPVAIHVVIFYTFVVQLDRILPSKHGDVGSTPTEGASSSMVKQDIIRVS